MNIFNHHHEADQFIFCLRVFMAILNLYWVGRDLTTGAGWQTLVDVGFMAWFSYAAYRSWRAIKDDDDDDSGTPIPIWKQALGFS